MKVEIEVDRKREYIRVKADGFDMKGLCIALNSMLDDVAGGINADPRRVKMAFISQFIDSGEVQVTDSKEAQEDEV